MTSDQLMNALISIKNHDAKAKRECIVRPASRLLGEVLRLLQKNSYIDGYEYVDDGRSGVYRISLLGKINECKAIKPRYAVKRDGFEKYEKRYLPARDVGLIFVSAPSGVITHTEAKKRETGGRLLAYVY